ncbi:MAG: hypothetical protein LUM44_10335 [Pyrinomonadaceae bacterium]|nr:hypothetical protein [Pyrinomonadaceae bacterium]
MKKFLALSLLLGSAVVFTPSETRAAETASNTTAVNLNESPQIQNRRWNRRGVRIVNRTRIVRRGYATYRETIQTRYQPNGRVTTRVISRVRIR